MIIIGTQIEMTGRKILLSPEAGTTSEAQTDAAIALIAIALAVT